MGKCGPFGGEGGPIFVRVLTDQGSIVANGTIQVIHGAADCGTASYGLILTPNATGYMQVSGYDTLVSVGSYDLTLIAGYGGDMTYTAVIAVVPFPETSYFVTISVPNSEVTSINCYLATSCSSETVTTSATISGI